MEFYFFLTKIHTVESLMYMFNLEVNLFDHLKNDGGISSLQERKWALYGDVVCTHLRSTSSRCQRLDREYALLTNS